MILPVLFSKYRAKAFVRDGGSRDRLDIHMTDRIQTSQKPQNIDRRHKREMQNSYLGSLLVTAIQGVC